MEPAAGRVARWYWFVVAATVGASLALALLMAVGRGKAFDRALGLTSGGKVLVLANRPGYDSWRPLLKASRREAENPASSPYDVFFEGQGKFQYPPTALFAAAWLPETVKEEALARWDGSALQGWHAGLSRLAILATIGLSAAIAAVLVRRGGASPAPPFPVGLGLGVLAAGLFFYPFLIGFEVGQIQLVLNALVAGAVLARVLDRPGLAGALVGLCCLVKPQFGVVLVWALLRLEWRMALGIGAVALPAVVLAGLRYGFAEYLHYLAVLRELSRRGEVLWYNQSLSGLLHRWVDPAAATYWDEIGSPLPPYRPLIHAASTLFGALLILVTLFVRKRPEGDARIVDLLAVIVASTIASPVAWNHHYGAFFPVFAAAVPLLLAFGRASLVLPGLLAAAYLAIGFELEIPEFLFTSRAAGVLASHMLAGGVLLLGLLLYARSVERPNAA